MPAMFKLIKMVGECEGADEMYYIHENNPTIKHYEIDSVGDFERITISLYRSKTVAADFNELLRLGFKPVGKNIEVWKYTKDLCYCIEDISRPKTTIRSLWPCLNSVATAFINIASEFDVLNELKYDSYIMFDDIDDHGNYIAMIATPKANNVASVVGNTTRWTKMKTNDEFDCLEEYLNE